MYSYSFITRAQNEYEEIIDWYEERSPKAADGFIESVESDLNVICEYPKRWRNVYKDNYELGLKKYPYNIVYSIEEEDKHIIVKSIFHHKRNPRKKFRRL